MYQLPIEGKWVSAMSNDTDDHLIEYTIFRDGNSLKVTAKAVQDEEQIEISDIFWDGKMLSFKSRIPSTKSVSTNKFQVKSSGNIEAKFTFTVVEELKRVD